LEFHQQVAVKVALVEQVLQVALVVVEIHTQIVIQVVQETHHQQTHHKEIMVALVKLALQIMEQVEVVEQELSVVVALVVDLVVQVEMAHQMIFMVHQEFTQQVVVDTHTIVKMEQVVQLPQVVMLLVQVQEVVEEM
jgi:hypothetical protein